MAYPTPNPRKRPCSLQAELNSNHSTVVERYEDSQRIKDLGIFIPFTNTERTALACPRLYALNYIEGLNPDTKSAALSFGVVYHQILEDCLNGVMQTDVMPDLQLAQSQVDETVEAYLYTELQHHADEILIATIAEEMSDKIKRSFEGWYNNWIKTIQPHYKVVGVEMVCTMPVRDFHGKPYAPTQVFVRETDGSYRLPTIAEQHSPSEDVTFTYKRTVPTSRMTWISPFEFQIPYYRIGKIDCLLEDRETGELWILDHKTTGSVAGFQRKFSYDHQLTSYAACMRWEIEEGAYQHLKGKEIAGVIWDLISSKPPKTPQPLKSGQLSTAANKSVPSYVFERAIIEHKLNREDYKEYIEGLAHKVDTNHNDCIFLTLRGDDLDRIQKEDYGYCYRITQMRGALAYKDNMDFAAPRMPYCQMYGTCKLGAVCISNQDATTAVMERIVRVRWEPENKSSDLFAF